MKGKVRIYPSLRLLWELVHSLNRFQIQTLKDNSRTSNGGGKVPAYINFFDVLRNAETFDEKIIRQKLRNTTTLRDFTDSRAYLYSAILKAIHLGNNDLSTEVSSISSQIKILMLKGLYSHIPELVKYGERFATETEDFEELIRLSRLNKSVKRHRLSGKVLKSEMQIIIEKEREWKTKLSNLNEWEHIFDLRFIAKGSLDNERIKYIQEIEKHPFVQNNGPCESVRAEIIRLSIAESMLSLNKIEHTGRIAYLVEIANLIEKNPSLLEDGMIAERYLYAVQNFGLLSILDKNIVLFNDSIRRLLEFDSKGNDSEVLVFERVETLRMAFHLHSFDVEKSSANCAFIRKGLLKYGTRMTPSYKLSLSRFVAFSLFLSKEFSEVAKFLHSEIESPLNIGNEKQQIVLWIFYLMAELELENQEILKNYSRYAQKYVKENGIGDEFSSLFFGFFKSYATKSNSIKKLSLLKNLENQLGILFTNKTNAYYDSCFPFREWVASKIEDKPLMSIIRTNTNA